MIEGFDVSTICGDDEVRLRLQGELDVAGMEDVGQAARRIAGPRRVVCDLSELRFIDSSGITALLDAAQLCRARGQSFTITGAHGRVQQVFAVAGVDVLLRGDE